MLGTACGLGRGLTACLGAGRALIIVAMLRSAGGCTLGGLLVSGILLIGAAGCESNPRKPPPPESAAPVTVMGVVIPPVNAVPEVGPRPGERLVRRGDEIMVAGQLFHTDTPVVLWTDPGGFDGYRVERRFAPAARADWKTSMVDNPELTTPNRYGQRDAVLTPAERAVVRGGGWPLELLQKVVDQFVLHYDASGTSARCFERLHDQRGLSVHFLLDVDGTVYQTLDLKERAWHATQANSRSIGIEIANLGAYPPGQDKVLAEWYRPDAVGGVRLGLPAGAHPELVRTPGFVARPDRPERIAGPINGQPVVQYDFTPEQYAALTKLTASLCAVFPRLRPEFPRGADGQVVPGVLSTAEQERFGGVLGHYHIQANKVDPGPAMQWERVINGARALLGLSALPRPAVTPVADAAPESGAAAATADAPVRSP